MKTKLLIFTLLVVFTSCSSDSEGDIQKDELLSNTEWIDSYDYAIINPDPQTPPPIGQILAYIQGT